MGTKELTHVLDSSNTKGTDEKGLEELGVELGEEMMQESRFKDAKILTCYLFGSVWC